MNIKWENIKSEEQFKIGILTDISVEKEGSDITAIYLSFEDGRDIKIAKSSDYSKFLNVFLKEPTKVKKEITYVLGKSEQGYITEAKVENTEEEHNVRAEFEELGYTTWTRKDTQEISVDVFSGEEIPF